MCSVPSASPEKVLEWARRVEAYRSGPTGGPDTATVPVSSLAHILLAEITPEVMIDRMLGFLLAEPF